jgi:hypothetical protein
VQPDGTLFTRIRYYNDSRRSGVVAAGFRETLHRLNIKKSLRQHTQTGQMCTHFCLLFIQRDSHAVTVLGGSIFRSLQRLGSAHACMSAVSASCFMLPHGSIAHSCLGFRLVELVEVLVWE